MIAKAVFQFFMNDDGAAPWSSNHYGPFDAIQVRGKTLEIHRDGRWWRIARCFHLENDRVYWKIDKEKDCPVFISEDDLPNREWDGIRIV